MRSASRHRSTAHSSLAWLRLVWPPPAWLRLADGEAATGPAGAAGEGNDLGDPAYGVFWKAVDDGCTVVPVFERVMSDHLSPITAYRCLVKEDDREAPSFLLESVVNGNQSGRYSFLGVHPDMEVVCKENDVAILDHLKGERRTRREADPLRVIEEMDAGWKVGPAPPGLPATFTGGWVGNVGYDTVRYGYSSKLPFAAAPRDDRNLPDLHFGLYNNVIIFDHAQKLAYIVAWVHVGNHPSTATAYKYGREQTAHIVQKLSRGPEPEMPKGNRVDMALQGRSASNSATSNMGRKSFLEAVAKTKEHILAGDIFQLVLSHRFERRTFADPFEIYRALRVVNPSPYMIYIQCRGSILVASSPEILCRVDQDNVVTNRPLAGTRKRGETPEQDLELEEDLLADEKERAEHVMLVDLGRNDVGVVARDGSVQVESMFDIERYSHVMHISSTVKGVLKEGLNAWDALRAALPVGTISGAPKVRAMQIIDELEVNRRGPYGGGVGYAAYNGQMDIALALRTMVIETAQTDTLYSYADPRGPRREWKVHLQAGAGVVADSVPELEYEETVNKAAGLARAIDLAESAFM